METTQINLSETSKVEIFNIFADLNNQPVGTPVVFQYKNKYGNVKEFNATTSKNDYGHFQLTFRALTYKYQQEYMNYHFPRHHKGTTIFIKFEL